MFTGAEAISKQAEIAAITANETELSPHGSISNVCLVFTELVLRSSIKYTEANISWQNWALILEFDKHLFTKIGPLGTTTISFLSRSLS